WKKKTEEDLLCFYLVEVICGFGFWFCFCFLIGFSKKSALNLGGWYEIMKGRGSYSRMHATSSCSVVVFVKMCNV
ncbi:hypothetical protein, partial [Priestia megaterium]|uniref:hypothetical protein n=1 Tax=Priestia megaterium TaxID=1404 RepID=UPI001C995010